MFKFVRQGVNVCQMKLAERCNHDVEPGRVYVSCQFPSATPLERSRFVIESTGDDISWIRDEVFILRTLIGFSARRRLTRWPLRSKCPFMKSNY
jgi:hypothetical protein